MTRPSVPAADALLGREYRVLDKGFVRLVDYLGGDARIVQSARVSYQDGTKSVREDAALIDYLVRHKHTSPLEQVVLTFHLKMPIFVARQWLRHRTARLNEISGRYSVMRDEFYLPDAREVRRQSEVNKQGRSDDEVPAELQARTLELLQAGQAAAYAGYQELLEEGLARELARINLPLSLYTEMYWQIDLHNLFHFLRLRLDAHAQSEIRAYAEVMAELARTVAPAAYRAFEEHILYAKTFSRSELELLLGALDRNSLKRALGASDLRKTRQRELLDKLAVVKAQEPETVS
jgi:thymidylate synthase (FAD)